MRQQMLEDRRQPIVQGAQQRMGGELGMESPLQAASYSLRHAQFDARSAGRRGPSPEAVQVDALRQFELQLDVGMASNVDASVAKEVNYLTVCA